MKIVLVGLLLASLLGSVELQYIPGMPGCSEDIPCSLVRVGGLTFQCRMTGPLDGTPVMMLHGFPEYSIWWLPQLQYWVDNETPFRAVACDLRGYSPLATPRDIEKYDYSYFIEDTWRIADAVGFDRFHLVGHDHGAALGWQNAAANSSRVISYAAMSVPHPDVMSDAIYGENAVYDQIYASNYFNQYAVANSSLSLWPMYKEFGGIGFPTASVLQPPLWWYYGSMAKYIAQPEVILSTTKDFLYFVQQALPIPVRPGLPQTIRTGEIDVPVLFICGELDPYLLCNLPYVRNTNKLVANYNTLVVSCGHDLMRCDLNTVNPAQQASWVYKGVTEFIFINEQ